MYAQSFDFDLTIDDNWLPDEDGNDVAGAMFNEKGTFTLNGFEKTGGFSAVLGAAITMANAIDGDSSIEATIASALTLVSGIKRSKQARAHQAIDVTGIYKPFGEALQV